MKGKSCLSTLIAFCNKMAGLVDEERAVGDVYRNFSKIPSNPSHSVIQWFTVQVKWSFWESLSLTLSSNMFEERGKDVWYAFSVKLKWKWETLKLSTLWELFAKTDNLLQDATEDFVMTILHRFLPENSSLLCDIPNYRQHTFGCRSKSSLRHSHSRQLPWAVKQPRLRSFILLYQCPGVSAWQLLLLPLRQEF